ncbi:MAG: GNAT family N-acetyltransferase [Oscillospiraceae bacterium]|nr:GNAT family N-acetyltransferase [Oscillospiraceae bacterium]
MQLKRVENEGEFALAYQIRVEVFVDEQLCPLDEEMDDYDKDAVHLLVFDGDEPVGTGRLIDFGDHYKIGRVAVRKKNRGQGFGNALCEGLINIAVAQGAKKIALHAQCQAEEFYRKLGFICEGEIFDDCGIDHITMTREF